MFCNVLTIWGTHIIETLGCNVTLLGQEKSHSPLRLGIVTRIHMKIPRIGSSLTGAFSPFRVFTFKVPTLVILLSCCSSWQHPDLRLGFLSFATLLSILKVVVVFAPKWHSWILVASRSARIVHDVCSYLKCDNGSLGHLPENFTFRASASAS